MKNVSYSWLRSVCKMSGVCVVVGASLCSSVAMGGGTCPKPQSGQVMGIAEIRRDKIRRWGGG